MSTTSSATSGSSSSTNRTEGTSRSTEGISSGSNVGASVSRDMATVSSTNVRSEAAVVTRGDTVADGVDATTSTTATPASYTVQSGDTLSGIARQNNTTLGAVISANPQISNPNLIHPGDTVNLPGGVTNTTPAGPVTPGGVLERGVNDPAGVTALQTRLTELGYSTGPVDGKFGAITQGAVRSFQSSNGLPVNGRADQATLDAMNGPNARRPDPARTEFPTYAPGSPEQIQLFQDAARAAGLPESWASSPGLINLLQAESRGRVGVPNYTYGDRSTDPTQWASVHEELRNGRKTATSSATGLGQLLLSNVDAYYPSGRQGIGNPQEEAVGMLRYIEARYGTPDAAWARYNTAHEGY